MNIKLRNATYGLDRSKEMDGFNEIYGSTDDMRDSTV
jgi:hypothetical protein